MLRDKLSQLTHLIFVFLGRMDTVTVLGTLALATLALAIARQLSENI
jgi:hypothetical protein